MNEAPKTLEWIGDAGSGYLRLIEQTLLPGRVTFLDCRDVETVWMAIKRLTVRGAPAIGIAAAYGCVIAAQTGAFEKGADYLATSRPTAVNLFWAIERMKQLGTVDVEALLTEAKKIHDEDREMCASIGRYGAELIDEGMGVLTHCNAGALATGGIGTATGPMYTANAAGKKFRVYADETRPLNQGSRLTTWELGEGGVDVTLICDDMSGQVMKEGLVDLVITGADRIAGNGDAANKIGTYGVAVLAKHHGIPFYVAAPSSTFDMSLEHGELIPIEQRDPDEIIRGYGDEGVGSGSLNAPEGAKVYNPAFDVTPADLITGLITEKGIIQPVCRDQIEKVLGL